jgi:hypothetical protein
MAMVQNVYSHTYINGCHAKLLRSLLDTLYKVCELDSLIIVGNPQE